MIACTQPDDSRDLRNYFDRIYWTKKIGRSPQTKRLYLLTLARFGEHLGRMPSLDDLNDDTCAAFIQERFEKVSQFAANKDRKNIAAIANYAAKKRHIEQWVMMPDVHVSWPEPTALRPEQVRDLLDACRRAAGKIGEVRASDWWRAFILIALTTGERTSAVLSIRKDWIDSLRWLRIPATVRKGKKKAMSYLLPLVTMDALAPLRPMESPLLLYRPFTDAAFYRRWGLLMQAAGLPSGRRWKPQILRRTFASYYKLAGGDATDALAHDSPKTTKQSYLDPTVTDAEQPGSVVARALGLG